MKNIIKYDCPHCKQELDVEVYPVINLQSDTELYEDLFTLELFKVECPHCKKQILIQYDLFVVDMYKKYLIYLCTSQNITQINTEQLYNSLSTLPEFNKTLSELKHTRIVSNLNELLEKLLIFDYDLNDKVIEIIKLSLIDNQKVNVDLYNNILFDKIEKEYILFTCLNTHKSNIQPINVSVDIKYYNLCIDKLRRITYRNQ